MLRANIEGAGPGQDLQGVVSDCRSMTSQENTIIFSFGCVSEAVPPVVGHYLYVSYDVAMQFAPVCHFCQEHRPAAATADCCGSLINFRRGQQSCRCETPTQRSRVCICQRCCYNRECVTNNCDVQNHHTIVQGCIKNAPIYFDLHRLMTFRHVYVFFFKS